MTAYEQLTHRLREAQTLISIAELLGWDQETMMPRKAAELPRRGAGAVEHARARASHRTRELGELLGRVRERRRDLCADPAVAANLREIRRNLRPRGQASRGAGRRDQRDQLAGHGGLEGGTRANDFALFLPWLEKQIELNRRKAECWGVPDGGEAYDALLDDYEPETTAGTMERIFGPLREALVPLIEALTSAPRRPDDELRSASLCPQERAARVQRLTVARSASASTARPAVWTSRPTRSRSVVGPGDTRITTRYRDDALSWTRWARRCTRPGHALYEQGLPKQRWSGQPLGEPLGLGIHESQSRLWENHVGRSRAFCRWAAPEMQRAFGAPLDGLTEDELYGAVNVVRPNLIRVESDEATYHLHIMLRFDLERAMIRGDLRRPICRRLERTGQADLGLDVPERRRGCLQDVHWSMGAIAYFPTYTLGSLYAAQLWEAVRNGPCRTCRPSKSRAASSPRCSPGCASNIHAHGRRYTADELCRRVTGSSLDPRPLMRHLDGKLRPLHGIASSTMSRLPPSTGCRSSARRAVLDGWGGDQGLFAVGWQVACFRSGIAALARCSSWSCPAAAASATAHATGRSGLRLDDGALRHRQQADHRGQHHLSAVDRADVRAAARAVAAQANACAARTCCSR